MAVSHFERSTLLGAQDVDAVWDAIASWEGIDAELAPIRMSRPGGSERLDELPADGSEQVTSVLSIWGLPFDRHRMTLVEYAPRSHFEEHSSNLLLRHWTHRRAVQAETAGVRITDQCSLEARLGFLGPLLGAIYRRVFARRHARLRERFGVASETTASAD